MNLSEFKAWLEGYEAGFTFNGFSEDKESRRPSSIQWAEIKKRLDATEPVTIPEQSTGRSAIYGNSGITPPETEKRYWWDLAVTPSDLGIRVKKPHEGFGG